MSFLFINTFRFSHVGSTGQMTIEQSWLHEFMRVDLSQVLTSQNYVMLPVQVDKVVQLYETMMTRHTTMIVGPTGGGKSVVLNTLASAQTKMAIPTKLYTINPKERSVVELYGVLDPNTRNWTDGLLSNIFRDINKPTDKNERKYIVYDGDVDALWVGTYSVMF